VEEDVAAQKANQTITITQAAPASAVYGSSFGVAATASSGLPVSIAASGAGTVSSGGTGSATVQMTSGTGTAAITFSQPGDNNYNAATVATEDVSAQKASQTITVTQAAPGSATYGSSFNVAATASSGLPVSIAASGAGTVSSGGTGSATVQMTSGTGTALVTFSQAGDNNYNPASVVTENVSAQKAGQTITLTQVAPANAVYGASFTVAATASSGLPVSIAAGGAASGSGIGTALVTITSTTGTATITFSQAGNSDYASASATVTVHVISPGVWVVGSELWYVSGLNANNEVHISPAGTSATGSTGIVVNGTTYHQAFTAVRFFGYNGNDSIRLSESLTINTFITDGNGIDKVYLGDGNNNVTLGNGNDRVHVGNGNNVIVTGNGTDEICAGNGNNLIVAGLGRHYVHAGNGSNILIDGSVQLTRSGDSLRQVLDDWTQYGAQAANVASIRQRLQVTYNSSYANTLHAGSGLDWFWDTYAGDATNRKATDLLN
jgi:hypothetical protein